jgi:mRNA degradation ribonuclease J1/J2
MATDPTPPPDKPEPRYRVTRIGAGHEGDLAAELEAAEAAGYDLDDVINLGNGDVLVIAKRPKAKAAPAAPPPAPEAPC